MPEGILQVYAEQYYHHVRSFPENLKQLSSAQHRQARRACGRKSSPKSSILRRPTRSLWRQFAYSLGVRMPISIRARPLPGNRGVARHFDEVRVAGKPAQAVAGVLRL